MYINETEFKELRQKKTVFSLHKSHNFDNLSKMIEVASINHKRKRNKITLSKNVR